VAVGGSAVVVISGASVAPEVAGDALQGGGWEMGDGASRATDFAPGSEREGQEGVVTADAARSTGPGALRFIEAHKAPISFRRPLGKVT
jgi:hypothetical protein